MLLARTASRVVARASAVSAQRAVSLAAAPQRSFAFTLYTKKHEYLRVDNRDSAKQVQKGDEAIVGITDYAQDALGDVVFVDLPDVEDGMDVGKGEAVVGVESTKVASDVYAPVAGSVTAVNSALGDSPSLVNESPYENGWMFKLKISNPAEVGELLDAAAYAKHCEEEAH